ncbi:DUF3551 domain-containing protein [Bradyrhizobium sp. USDA 372]
MAAATLSFTACLGSSTSATAQDRYCLQGRTWGYPGFASYAQCMATASGTQAHCDINPRYAQARRNTDKHLPLRRAVPSTPSDR